MIGWIVFVFIVIVVALALAWFTAREKGIEAIHQVRTLEERCLLLGQRNEKLIDEKAQLKRESDANRADAEKWRRKLEKNREWKAVNSAKAVRS